MTIQMKMLLTTQAIAATISRTGIIAASSARPHKVAVTDFHSAEVKEANIEQLSPRHHDFHRHTFYWPDPFASVIALRYSSLDALSARCTGKRHERRRERSIFRPLVEAGA